MLDVASLMQALRDYGEDAVASAVLDLPEDHRTAISVRAGEFALQGNRTGQALAMAEVIVVEGKLRPLRRARRCP